MITSERLWGKLHLIEQRYGNLRFKTVGEIPAEKYETMDYLKSEPENGDWKPVQKGDTWGRSWLTAWFRADVTIPKECDGERVFIRARTGAGESLFLVNGKPWGVFDDNHPSVMLTSKGVTGEVFHIALESYSGHTFPGTQPHEEVRAVEDNTLKFEGIEVALELQDVTAFVFDFVVLRNLANALPETSLRRNRIIKCLADVYATVDFMPQEIEERHWRPKLSEARKIMKPLLDLSNSPTTPWYGMIGHSHLDTAWLWPLRETNRKSARTFSSVLNLMEQYPEFMFIQNVPCHHDMIRQDYPELFGRIQQKVKEGRWEPNGPMWVEPDCNIPSGESLVRQLLLGQMTNREMFGYTSDTLWLPDVFGYSATLPQLLKDAGVDFFCTTKIGWNDTTRFPYDTFVWKGIDGTSVISHFNVMALNLDPGQLVGGWNWVQHKDVQDRRFCAFGYGDGGGGPHAEAIEIVKRVEDLEGCPKTRYMTLSDFMKGIEKELTDIPVYSGELYLEAHRGTLTSIAKIKKGNRRAELALRDAEYFCTLAALSGAEYPGAEFGTLWKELLTNQFHDILPGSSIQEVNEEAIASFERIVDKANGLTKSAIKGISKDAQETITVWNSLSWERSGEIILNASVDDCVPSTEGSVVQEFENLFGERKVAVTGISIPALASVSLPLKDADSEQSSPFSIVNNILETPCLTVQFNENGQVHSCVEKPSGRELVKPGSVWNTFYLGEDVPAAWDNWDIDADQRMKMQKTGRLIERKVLSDGPLQLRIRSRYALTESTEVIQDMVFHSTTSRIDFETIINWEEKHQLLKVGFAFDLLANSARHEIQYGHVERPTHTNLKEDRARFEVCAHKWTDVSENGIGVALLNDCKYGVSVEGTDVRLTLIKSGTHPDPRGDAGEHKLTYSILPHSCAFSVESVIRPAYELNVPVVETRGLKADVNPLVAVDVPNVIIESVKMAEDGDGFIVRVYEAEKTGTNTTLTFDQRVKSVVETNLLEETTETIALADGKAAVFLKALEVKTFRCKV